MHGIVLDFLKVIVYSSKHFSPTRGFPLRAPREEDLIAVATGAACSGKRTSDGRRRSLRLRKPFETTKVPFWRISQKEAEPVRVASSVW